mgnify:FL=1
MTQTSGFTDQDKLVALAKVAPETTALAVPTVEMFKTMLEENYGDANAQPEFPRIKYPTCGAVTFWVTSPEGVVSS